MKRYTLQELRDHIDTIPPQDIGLGAYFRDYRSLQPGCTVGHLMSFVDVRHAAQLPIKCAALANRLRLIQQTNDANAHGSSRKAAVLRIFDSFIREDAVLAGAAGRATIVAPTTRKTCSTIGLPHQESLLSRASV